MTHAEMIDAFNAGRLALGVEPAKARQLFTDLDPNQLAELVGERMDRCLDILSLEGSYLDAQDLLGP